MSASALKEIIISLNNPSFGDFKHRASTTVELEIKANSWPNYMTNAKTSQFRTVNFPLKIHLWQHLWLFVLRGLILTIRNLGRGYAVITAVVYGRLMNSRIITVRVSVHYKNQLFHHVIVFLSYFVYPGLDFLWATRLLFLEKHRMLTLPVHLIHIHATSIWWRPNFSFAFVSLDVLFWLFHVLSCACLFSLSVM